ncbi:MAG: ABC transporter ATP-binding protein [Terriglobia bacterium]
MSRKTKKGAEAIVAVVDVHKKYKLGRNNFVHALRGTSLEIETGDMTAVMGPSGSGKSTLMHIMGGLDKPDQGEVHVGGDRIDNLASKRLPRLRATRMGFIFQGFNLIPTLNALENVALTSEYKGVSRRESSKLAAEQLGAVGLGDRLKHRPSELSGGEQHRVAIARAFVNKPEIILGDEPTGDLDTETSAEIMSIMRERNESTGTTFVLVTHDPEIAAMCDRQIQMRDGVITNTTQR